MNIRRAIPWWGKVAAKAVLSRVPMGYGTWERLGLFKHGHMEQFDYALRVFRSHFDRSRLTTNLTICEIGPGDSLFTAVIAKALGASRCYLVDVGAFAHSDMAPYRRLIAHLDAIGLPMPTLRTCDNLEALLAACNAVYLTNGVQSFREIPDASVDLIFSQAVLEHVRRQDFDQLVREMRRAIRPGGIGSHAVDLKDHLGGRLNHLRFSERVWESDFMARSGFYTNRIRFSEMLDRFRRGGFQCDVLRIGRFDELPTARAHMAHAFATLADDDLVVSDFDVVLR